MPSLKNKTITALLWDFLGSYSTQGVTFIVSIFLSRLLTPAEFGLVGMAMVFIVFSQAIINVGFSTALIQNKENQKITYSSVFYVNIAIAGVLFAIFQLLAHSIARFYNQPSVESVIRYLSIGMLINSLNLVQVAILKRELQFKSLNIRLFFANLISGIIGIILAYSDWGIYALVVQNLVAATAGTLILWKVSSWQPRWEFSFQEIKNLFKFSGYVFFDGLLYNLLQNGYLFIIGKLFSPMTLGFYTRANSLRTLVSVNSSNSINRVFLTLLSKVQDEKSTFDRYFLKGLNIVSIMCFFLTGVLFFSAEWIIITLFGDQWIPSITIFQILVFTLFSIPINSFIINTFLALGKSKETFWLGLVRSSIMIPPIFAAFIGGFDAFLWTLVIINYIGVLFNIFTLHQYGGISVSLQLKSIIPFFIYAFIGVLITYILSIQSDSLILKTLLNNLIYSLCYLSLIAIFNKPIVSDLLSLLPCKTKKWFSEKKIITK